MPPRKPTVLEHFIAQNSGGQAQSSLRLDVIVESASGRLVCALLVMWCETVAGERNDHPNTERGCGINTHRPSKSPPGITSCSRARITSASSAWPCIKCSSKADKSAPDHDCEKSGQSQKAKLTFDTSKR
uniref:Uncharacterized protein n=1 Tax=Ulva partita TaxID=1605170 RepID=A0A1C9ZWA2_9CHLO|nr:hypothetical protein [Ulva partita]